MKKKIALGLLAATVLCSTSFAQEVTLRAVTAFAEKTTYSRPFEKFIEQVNADGKGIIQINYIGGPKAMPPFEVGNALKTGVGFGMGCAEAVGCAEAFGLGMTSRHAGL